MAAVIEEGQELKRIVFVYGVGDCELTLMRDRVALRVPGSRSYVTCSWARIVEKAGQTETSVPCFLADDGIKLLLHEKSKVEKRRAKKEGK